MHDATEHPLRASPAAVIVNESSSLTVSGKRSSSTARIPGASGTLAYLPVDQDVGSLLTILDGQLIRTEPVSRSAGAPDADVMLEGPSKVIESILRGVSTLAENLHHFRISGDVWALFCLPVVLSPVLPHTTLDRGGRFANLVSVIGDEIQHHRSIQGYQLWIDIDGHTIETAVGHTTGGRPMASSTMHHVRCATKWVLALAAQLLELEGRVDLDLPLRRLSMFPGLTESRASVRDMLCHDAGLGSPRQIEMYFAGPRRDEVLRSTSSSSPYECYSEIAAWHILECWLEHTTGIPILELLASSVPEQSLSMLSYSQQIEHLDVGTYFTAREDLVDPMPLLMDLTPGVNAHNSPAFGGLTSAQGIGSLYRLASHGSERVRRAISEMLRYTRGIAYDPVLERDANFSVGFMIDLAQHGFGSAIGDRAFGHTGWMGSSWGFHDPEARITCAFLHNGIVSQTTNDSIRECIVNTLYGWIE